jgi:phosphocarrier protein
MVCEKAFQIKNKLGLHARAAAQFVKTANRFSSEVTVIKEATQVNGKSILGVLTLAAACGTVVTVRCEGSDADESIAALEKLIEAKFQEE